MIEHVRFMLGSDGSGRLGASAVGGAGGRGRVAWRLAGGLVVVVCAVLGLGVGSAFALNWHVFSGSFGGEGAGNGLFVEPSGVAVNDATGDVYVVDRGNDRVEVFSAAGAYISQFDGSGAPTGVFSSPSAIAVDDSGSALDPSAGDVYVLDTGHDVIDKFSATGVYEGQLKETTGGALFGELDGVAVDPNGLVWVYQASNEIDSFSDALSNEFLSSRNSPYGTGPGLAVDSEDNLYVRRGEPYFAKLNSAGGSLIEAMGGEVEVSSGAAVDLSNDEVFIDNVTSVGAFTSTGAFVDRFGDEAGVEHLQGGSGIAVDPVSGTVYVADSARDLVDVFDVVVLPDVVTGPAEEVGPRGARLTGTVNPDGLPVKDCHFDYGTSTSYGQVAPCVPAAGSIPVDSSVHAVSAQIAGLVPGVTYHFRLQAEGANELPNFGGDVTFSTPPRPAIDSATVSGLTEGSAVLDAKIMSLFSEAHYHFEYDTRLYAEGEAGHGVRVPAREGEDPGIPGNMGDVSVSAPIAGLEASTHTYYWRVVASNESGTTVGVQQTFFYDTSGGGLPDGRAYELVTPPHKNGADMAGAAALGLRIAPDGLRVMASTLQCFAGAEACEAQRGVLGGQFEFTRTAGGWVTTPLVPPASVFGQYSAWGYDASTGAALFSMPTPASLGGEGEDDFYVRDEQGGFLHVGPDTPPALGAQGPHGGVMSDMKQAFTADFSHIAWEMQEEFAFEPGTGPRTVYEYTGTGNARPLLVGVSGSEGSNSLISECETHLGDYRDAYLNPGSMSADGRTVFFTAVVCGSGTHENVGRAVPADTVYARVDGELPDAHTVAISDPSPSECGNGGGAGEMSCRAAAAGPPERGEFMGASVDGSKALFFSPEQLTDAASEDPNSGVAEACHGTTEVNGCNLYEYDFANPTGRELVDVSAGDSSGEGPRVQGVVAFSPDGSHVYFVAKGVLSAAPNERGQIAQNGAENLYLFERDAAFPDGRTVFISDLRPGEGSGDEEEWFHLPGEPANVTPDGRFLVFVSHRDLTADDTSLSGARQVFRYDAVSGRLNRVSIGNEGYNDGGSRSAPTPCSNANFGCAEDAEIAPVIDSAVGAERSDPSMSDDGSRVFFSSPVALAPHALDDLPIGVERGGLQLYAQNVYEWEQEGVGSCPAGRTAGCVFLISAGRDTHAISSAYAAQCEGRYSAVCLLGADSEGRNVFFATADSLVPGDANTEVDFYDARVCEAVSPCVSGPPSVSRCAGEECHGTPAGAPGAPAAATATFDGRGNLVPSPSLVVRPRSLTRARRLAAALGVCRRQRSRSRRAGCERQARKKYGVLTGKQSRKAGRASNDRRAR
jgi:DNA-binding beta-propeller fold protein YncE